MAERDQEQKLEELLDSMLAAYSAAESRPGLETRVVANLRALGAQSAGRSWGRMWLWAGAGVAAVIGAWVLAALHWPGVRPNQAPTAIVNSTPQAVPEAPSPSGDNARGTGVKAVTTSRHKAGVEQVVDMRPDVFPTPAPLSEQEKLMLRYLAGTPREEIVAQSHVDEALQDALPDNQTALPGTAITNSQLSNTR